MPLCTASGDGWACDREATGSLCGGHRTQRHRGEALRPLRRRRGTVAGMTAQTYELTPEEHAAMASARGETPESQWVAEAIRERLARWAIRELGDDRVVELVAETLMAARKKGGGR